jgi:hypothetical protein
MKKLALLFGLVAFSANAQKTIKSIKLDSAVFQCINQVRIENNQPSALKFFYGKVREFSYTVTDKNCDASYFEHSTMDSTRKYCNAECIYQHKLIFGDATKYDIDLHPDQIYVLAKHVVDSWMNSPSHRNAILMSWNRSFTITSQIEISQNGKSVIVSVSYHAVQYTNKLLEIPYGLRDTASYYMK